MSVPPRPRSPRRLPRRVYWFRRVLLLVVLAVVVGTGYGAVSALAGALHGGNRDVAAPASAEVAGGATGTTAEPTTGTPTGAPTAASGPSPSPTVQSRRAKASRTPLPQPDGVCKDSDVLVRPRVDGAHLGDPIQIVLEVSTRSTPACTWEVAPDSVFLKVTRGAGSADQVVWSSQECPRLMPTAQVVARRQTPAEVVVSWSGRKSDPDCSDVAGWVHTGSYQATAVARGAVTPLEQDFEIAAPKTLVVPSPSPTPSRKPSNEASNGPSEKATDVPSGSPTASPSQG